MFTRVHLSLALLNPACLPMPNRVYYVNTCLPMFTTFSRACLPKFTHVCSCLPMFTL